MALEMTRNRVRCLTVFSGEITLEGECQNEIVIRIPFQPGIGAEIAYNHLLDVEDDRCENCGRYDVKGLIDGLCTKCNDEINPCMPELERASRFA